MNKEVASLTATVQATLSRQSDLGVELESTKGDLTETQRSVAADQELAAKPEDSCGTKSSGVGGAPEERHHQVPERRRCVRALERNSAKPVFGAGS